MQRLEKHLYEFGPFRLDAGERVLLKGEEYIPLAPKAFETLLALVQHSGRILDKEDLLRQVWPDTFVEEVSLAKNISTLRKALGEGVDGQRYIETIPKRGYRFVAPVRHLDEEHTGAPSERESPPDVHAAPSDPAAALDGTAEPRTGRRVVLPFVLLAAIGVAGLLVYLANAGRRQDTAPTAVEATPLTTYPGGEDQVAFSPDGSQIAFTWDEREDRNRDICVKLIGTETLLRLTKDAGDNSKPAWSPDGRQIAFVRSTKDSRAYYLVSALGGAERKLADVSPYMDLGVGNSTYFSPDGRQLAIVDRQNAADPTSIFLLSTANSQKLPLTTPAAGATGDYYPAFSPNGRMLAFVRSSSLSTTDLYVMPASGGEPKRLTFDGLTIQGLAWTTDASEIVFSSRRGGSISSLWRVPAGGGVPRRISAVGKDVVSPAISRDRLAYTQAVEDMNIWRLPLDGAAGKEMRAERTIASTLWDADPDYSPDGRRIVFSSSRSGGFGIWVCDSDGNNPRLLFDGGPYLTGSPRWSPDGRWIAFDSRSQNAGTGTNPDIFVISAEGGEPRRVTADPGEDVAPSWSRDGRWIYFGSARSGVFEIWKAPTAGGRAVQVTRQGGFEAFESPDGSYLYYLKRRGSPGIWRVPASGGAETLVTDRNQAGLWRYWRVASRGVYYATASAPDRARLEFFDVSTGQVSTVALLPKGPDVNVPGLAISPDGRWALYSQKDQSGSDLMMVEGFR